MNYSIRERCIFCSEKLEDFIEEDLSNFVAHYPVTMDDNNDYTKIPYNVCVCSYCKTPQIKYLGDISEVYRINHADSTGNIMKELHMLNMEFIKKYKDKITSILEIGSSKGILADSLINELDIKYTIVEPSFIGDVNNKIIIKEYFENIDSNDINDDTIVMSHVFEHFYNPLVILKKIKESKIKNIFLVFPDLEYYINNKVLHVLNTEHTFYVDNEFLINLFDSYGFKLIEMSGYIGHSNLFYFEKQSNEIKKIDFKNKNYDLFKFFLEIEDTVNLYNKEISEKEKVYLWPSSVHSFFLFTFGLNYAKLAGMLDNSEFKIKKKTYGTNIPIYRFSDIVESDDENYYILTNGGLFNEEVRNLIINNKHDR